MSARAGAATAMRPRIYRAAGGRSCTSQPPHTWHRVGSGLTEESSADRASPQSVHRHAFIPGRGIPVTAAGQTIGSLPGMRDDDPSTETLRIEQIRRERTEREQAERAGTEAEQRAARRRADKARYLRDKLGEQAENPDEPS